jgi:cell division septal protein FtsQ
MEPGDGLAEDEDEVEVEVEEFEPLARTGRETSRPSDGNGVGVVFLPKYEP